MRSLNSRVVVWPRPTQVDVAVRRWAADLGQRDSNVVRIGYFGSYARGDWGVGSDVDLVVLLRQSDRRFEMRSLCLPYPRLPVPADVLVYTLEEWQRMTQQPGFARTADREAVWVYPTDS